MTHLVKWTDRERDQDMVSIITNLQCLTSRCSSISIQPMIILSWSSPSPDCVLAGGCCRCWWCCTWQSTSSGTRRKASPPSTFGLMSKVHSAIKVSCHPCHKSQSGLKVLEYCPKQELSWFYGQSFDWTRLDGGWLCRATRSLPASSRV